MISDITGIDYELLKDNTILETTELPINTKNEKAKRCDFVIRILDNNIINLELNAYRYNGLIVKNLSYLFQLFANTTKKGEKYDDDLVVMQININCYKEDHFKPLSKYIMQEETTHRLYSKNIVIYDLNVVKCHEVYYNLDNKEDIPNYIRWGALIYSKTKEEAEEILKGITTSKERNLIMGNLSKLTKEDLFYTEEEALEWAEWERKSIAAEIRENVEKEVRNKSIIEGREENTKELIISMLKNNIDLETVSKITNKTIEEIKEIIKQ